MKPKLTHIRYRLVSDSNISLRLSKDLIRAIRISGLKGLEIYSSAPQLKPFNSSSSLSLAVKITIFSHSAHKFWLL